jgi:flagellar basal-body rod protein FlgF
VLQRAGGPGRVAFVQDAALVRDLDPGPMSRTGNPLDVALDGEGYLAFATPDGTRYGRAGRLELDAAGQLVNAQGRAVLDEGGNPVLLPADDRAVTIGEDGTVANRAGPIARLGVWAFANEQALRHVGEGLYAADEAPAPAEGARLVQGALEGSNVRPVLEMTAMLETARAFEGTQRMIETEHELERQAIERLVRVAG